MSLIGFELVMSEFTWLVSYSNLSIAFYYYLLTAQTLFDL